MFAESDNPIFDTSEWTRSITDAIKRGDADFFRAAHKGLNRYSAALKPDFLSLAAQLGQSECLSFFLSPLTARAFGSDGWTALMHAAAAGHDKCITRLLPFSDARAHGESGWTAFLLAALGGHCEALQALAPTSDALGVSADGKTALMWSSHLGHEAATRFLARRCALDAQDCQGDTALLLALRAEHSRCAAVLVPCSDLSLQNHQGDSPLMVSAEQGLRMELSSILICADTNERQNSRHGPRELARQTDSQGRSALMRAARANRLECLRNILPISIPAGIDLRGWTAITHAAAGNAPEALDFLLTARKGHFLAEEMTNALIAATTAESVDCVRLLLSLKQ